MNWYKVKEKSAGEGRLLVSWYLYKIFGEKILLLIAFFVALVSFIMNKDVREYSQKYFQVISDYWNDKTLKPSLINEFKHVLSFANSLVYKLETFDDTFKFDKIKYSDYDEAQKMFSKMPEGLVFIFPHIGNVEIMRSLLLNAAQTPPTSISIFMQREHCQTFRNFMKKIEKEHDKIKIYEIEDIDLSTVSEIDDNLKNGGILFVSGDRIAINNPGKSFEATLFNKKILLPEGSYKLARIFKKQIYFLTCIKEKGCYKVYFEDNSNKTEEELRTNFTAFMEKMTKIAPYQFYHFYDMFLDK